MKVNVLALVGAFLGILCIITPWTTITTEILHTATSTTDLSLTDYIHDDDSAFAFAVVLFILGCAFAFITPFGGVGQFFGWLVFLGLVYERLGTKENALASTTTSLGIGFYLGIVAAALVLIAMIKPLGLGYTKEAPQPKNRFLVWSD
jgi:hypothetical protein